MNISVNENEVKLNIGCRTFISATELLRLLGIDQQQPFTLQLNGDVVPLQNLPQKVVANTDTVKLLGALR